MEFSISGVLLTSYIVYMSLCDLRPSYYREARSKNCVVIYSFTVIVLHRAVLENHFAL